ncbi:capsule assembly Wzi family protein [Pelagicoccus sp. SDUM812002]|uniref:capsule assembly Wzi family protein n=1 Tax=Pelagicoccus sp. SDUM812002 TaxID=3041266 RepID=UPI00280F37A0|nr:capsule assembly Wzi family protein [Pelagicoccus sp. SDUM812002]MDQ8186275.1 capsule assembly Wzi family protein [Pelagicoccus sp. SDUM812002]
MKNTLITLVSLLASNAAASPRIDSNSIADRHDMLLLQGAGDFESAVLTWPWPLGRKATDTGPASESSNSGYESARERFAYTYQVASELGWRPTEASLALASDTLPFPSFGSQPRQQFEASLSQAWLSEWFAGNISLNYSDNPPDRDEFRLDGSYLAVALGNWSFGIDQVDRWWGPGWDGSLILSNNARPVPALSLTRISPYIFDYKWLKWVGPWTLNTFTGQLDNDEGDRPGSDARLFGMRIDFSPFGWNNLDIGLSRTAQWAGDRRPGDLSTFWRLLIGEDNRVNGVTFENEPGNQLAGIDYRLRIPGWNVAQYAQLTGEDEETYLPDANMILAGVETWGELDAQKATWRAYFEWADTRAGYIRRDPRPDRDFNTAYNHGIYRSGYRRKGRAIGHAMDGDGVMRSIGVFIVQENGNLWGAKYRNYSLNRDGRGPNSVTIDPAEGSSIEGFFELDLNEFSIFNLQSSNIRVTGGLHYIDQENQGNGESDPDFGGHLSIVTSF